MVEKKPLANEKNSAIPDTMLSVLLAYSPRIDHEPRGESTMIDHISIGVRDVAAAKKFYDAALAPLGYSCLSAGATSLGYGKDGVALWVGAAERPVPADDASGLHICFSAADRKSVDAFHAKALRAGGRDNGKPGLRKDYGANYYAAFVVDPDGYRIEAYCSKPA
jgi:catechol 2,3-dioxygenase-like lactoylglutathione lyase family enzyme